MARRKNLPESVQVKCQLSERLHLIRNELFGERGGSEMARKLGLPVRTWYNYETGVTVPAEVILRFVELTSVEPLWLLHGRGPKYRTSAQPSPETHHDHDHDSVRGLLRTALQRLEARTQNHVSSAEPLSDHHASNGSLHSPDSPHEIVLIRVEGTDQTRLTDASGPSYMAARRQWLAAERECRCVRVEGDAMAPIVSDNALVAYADTEEPYPALDGQLVVAWIQNQPLVRWFNLSGRYGLLRVQNPENEPATQLIDLHAPPADRRIRRVLWLSTPH